jgi:adenine-specific DNA-methyltransferase
MRAPDNTLFSDTPEKKYAAVSNPEQVKQLGQFFTPFPIARFMAKWVIGNSKCKKVLDPAVGLGIFFRAILQETHVNIFEFIGYDVDPRVLKQAKELFKDHEHSQIKLINRDYMFNDWNNRYDGIICNPPYQ